MRRVIVESPYAGDIDVNVRYARKCMTGMTRPSTIINKVHELLLVGLARIITSLNPAVITRIIEHDWPCIVIDIDGSRSTTGTYCRLVIIIFV